MEDGPLCALTQFVMALNMFECLGNITLTATVRPQWRAVMLLSNNLNAAELPSTCAVTACMPFSVLRTTKPKIMP